MQKSFLCTRKTDHRIGLKMADVGVWTRGGRGGRDFSLMEINSKLLEKGPPFNRSLHIIFVSGMFLSAVNGGKTNVALSGADIILVLTHFYEWG